MLRCIAIDDEPLALELLEDNIRQLPYLEHIASFGNAVKAVEALQKDPVDLIFLDIQMPGLTGLQLIKTLTVKPMVILVTAYEKFALEGFNLDVVDYLLKPVSLDRFIKASNKALELHSLRAKKMETPGVDPPDFFFVNVEYSLLKVVFGDIQRIEGLKDYVKIYLKSPDRPVVTRMSLKALEDKLPMGQFIRIHKSHIVSVACVTSVRKNSLFIGQLELPVSENFKAILSSLTGRSL